MRARTLAIFVAVALCGAAALYAQTNVVTEPVGFITLTAEGTNAGVRYTFLSLGLTQPPCSRGLITAVSGTRLTVNDTLTNGQFNVTVTGSTTNPVAFIEVTSGTNAGLIEDIVSNDTTSVFTASDISSLVASGETYKIYRHWTLASVFGATNDVGLTGGTSVGNADNVVVFNPVTQSSITYYYKSGGIGGTGWRASGSSDNQSNAVLYVDQGFYILRRATNPSNLSFKTVGAVKVGPTLVPVAAANSFVANVYPAGMTLGTSGLYTTNAATGVQGGSSAGNADNVNIWNQSLQKFDTYYYKSSGIGGTGWRLSGYSYDASNTPINVGTMLHILRRSSTGFNWRVQQPFTLE